MKQVFQLRDVLSIDIFVDFGQMSGVLVRANEFFDLLGIEPDIVNNAHVGSEGAQDAVVTEVHNAVFIVFLQGVRDIPEMGLVFLEDIGFILGKRHGQKDVRDRILFWWLTTGNAVVITARRVKVM